MSPDFLVSWFLLFLVEVGVIKSNFPVAKKSNYLQQIQNWDSLNKIIFDTLPVCHWSVVPGSIQFLKVFNLNLFIYAIEKATLLLWKLNWRKSRINYLGLDFLAGSMLKNFDIFYASLKDSLCYNVQLAETPQSRPT